MVFKKERNNMSEEINQDILNSIFRKAMLKERENSRIRRFSDSEMRNKIKEIIQNEVN